VASHAEHIEKAEAFLGVASRQGEYLSTQQQQVYIQAALVHATLAVALKRTAHFDD
jgi:hypothetical protein